MKKRSITDHEISLIKAMINRKMANKEIQFFFNRPDRPVNSGRITGIKNGKYSNSSSISAASDDTLADFLKNFEASNTIPTIAISVEAGELQPMDDEVIARMFKKTVDGPWRFLFGESDRHECKENFGFKHSDRWLRAVAALANHQGGYIVFGVKDKTVVDGHVASDSQTVIGMNNDDFEHADPADFTKKIKSTFDPTPLVETRIEVFEGSKVGILYVHPHPSPPIIATKNDGASIKEGDIYYRYPGQSARIKYSDLRTILDDRDKQAREQILPMVQKLLAVGPRNAMVADLSNGVLSDGQHSLTIGEELLKRIEFIREGEFDEKEGAPTLRLIGEVQAVDATGEIIRKGFAAPSDLIRDFYNLDCPHDPMEYIRCAVEVGNGAWLPMHYYARKADISRIQLVGFIAKSKIPAKRKNVLIARVVKDNSAFMKAGGASLEFLAQLKEGKLPNPNSSVDVASNIAKAIVGLEARPDIALEDLLKVLADCWSILEEGKPTSLSVVRKATARVDELYFQTISKKPPATVAEKQV